MQFTKKAPNEYAQAINNVMMLWEYGCDADWWVYIELAKRPAGNAILQLVMPSMLDIVRGYFRPKGLRTGRHMRRNRKGRRFRFDIPDSSELIAKRVYGYEYHRARAVTDGIKHLWRIDGVMQRIFWYWLVAEVSKDFFLEWTTAIMESRYCQNQSIGYGSISLGPSQTIFRGQWQTIFWQGASSNRGTVNPPSLGGQITGSSGRWTPQFRVVGDTDATLNEAQFILSETGFGTGTAFAVVGDWKPRNPLLQCTLEMRVQHNGSTVWFSDQKSGESAINDEGILSGPIRLAS